MQGKGVGRALLRHAAHYILQAADIAGIRGLAVHAKNEEARRFYKHFDFVPTLQISCTSSSFSSCAQDCL
jgi:GNAT superfamily N-acetyltransferase